LLQVVSLSDPAQSKSDYPQLTAYAIRENEIITEEILSNKCLGLSLETSAVHRIENCL